MTLLFGDMAKQRFSGDGTMRDYLKAAARRRPPPKMSPCLEDGQIAAFYSRQLDAGKEEILCAHLIDCPKCLEVSRDARQFLRLMTASVEANAVGMRAQSMSAHGSACAGGWFRR